MATPPTLSVGDEYQRVAGFNSNGAPAMGRIDDNIRERDDLTRFQFKHAEKALVRIAKIIVFVVDPEKRASMRKGVQQRRK
ncbi:hypothetical protein AWB82_05939 [Caballeronia glebae]|uniref:Uncharacterized protein n=1 Tax=Caballeronia glebae TaxID=1777143 RepID=A0A158CX30_9BURK|nr:hypothetical protein AWB82_05939 [Caballeronia glebae]